MAVYRVPVLEDFSWQPPVEDKDLTTAPTGAGVTKGKRYIVAANGGNWSGGAAKDIATAIQAEPADPAHWMFDTPSEGWTVWVLDENCYYHYTGAAWDKDDVDAMASDILSIEVLASDTLESLHAYESALSNETSVVKSSYLSDLASAISDIDSAIAAETASLATAISGVSNLAQSNYDSINTMHSSLQAYESALSNETSAVKASAAADFATNSNLISNISNALSAVSNLVEAINVSALSNLAESCQDSINLLYSSLHTYESALSDETSAVSAAAHDEFQTNSNLISAVSNSLSVVSNLAQSNATAIASVETIASDALAAAASVETRMLSVTSDMTDSINTMVDSAISSLKSDAHSEMLSQVKILSDLVDTMVDSAISTLAASTQTIGSYIAAYGAIEFTI